MELWVMALIVYAVLVTGAALRAFAKAFVAAYDREINDDSSM
jgi:hypothetical protein